MYVGPQRTGRDMPSKKEVEQIVLDVARNAGVPIPDGGDAGEEPDFRFHTETGDLGIEVSELLRPASTNHGILPLEQENFHGKVLAAARRECEKRGLPPLRVQVSFTNPRGERQYWQNLTRSLVEVIVSNYEKAQPAWSQAAQRCQSTFNMSSSSVRTIRGGGVLQPGESRCHRFRRTSHRALRPKERSSPRIVRICQVVLKSGCCFTAA